ncbi:3-oxoacyl-ACP synthase III family protein [Sorangium sp. So ce1024]|uniref:3-oxoacyl-ACP synthase III family protein n=1 Tax=unclassified Sorangium TaxID=2621164 RepID=UPI003EFC670C
MKAQIVDVVSFMPERRVVNEPPAGGSQDALADNAFFSGVHERRFASPDYLSEDLGVRAVERLLKRTGVLAESIDLIICSCIFSDTFWPGIGPAIQHRVGAKHATILNIDTSCSSYLSGLNAARAFIESGQYKRVVVVTVTNFISRLPEFQKSRRSFVLGDGASATLLVPGEASILARYERSHGEYYGLFRFEPDFVDGQFKNYWERGCGPITVNFSKDMVEAIRANAMQLVPDAVGRCLAEARLSPSDVSLLITHQPNDTFLREWRARIGILPPRTHDTLERYGNMFQGSIPVTLADALEIGRVRRGDIIALGTFSNGGDFVSAMVLRWQ